MDNSPSSSASPAPSLLPATPAGGEKSAPRSALASEAGAFSSGRLDNNGALLGVSGAKFVDPASKPPLQFDASGNPVPLDDKGYPVKKPGFGQSAAGGLSGQSGPGQGAIEKGPGESFNKALKAIEEQRKLVAAADLVRTSAARKQQILDDARRRGGSLTRDEAMELSSINRDVFNLPADHTGY